MALPDTNQISRTRLYFSNEAWKVNDFQKKYKAKYTLFNELIYLNIDQRKQELGEFKDIEFRDNLRDDVPHSIKIFAQNDGNNVKWCAMYMTEMNKSVNVAALRTLFSFFFLQKNQIAR